jgi:hypothetical protein
MTIKTEMKGDNLVITVDCSQAARDVATVSSTGKTRMLGTTSGFTALATPHGIVKASLNVTIPLAG